MTDSQTFRIPGPPASWQVFTRQGPPPVGVLRCQAYQDTIRIHLRREWGNRAPLEGPVALDTQFWLPWKGPTKSPGAIARWRWKHLAMRPDIDNCRKACSDACQGILFHDDSQVVRGALLKDFDPQTPEGYTVITIRSITEVVL